MKKIKTKKSELNLKNKTKTGHFKINIKKLDLNAIVTVLVLIVAPLIGLFLLPRKALAWKSQVKVFMAVITILLYLPFHAGIVLWLMVGGIYYIGPHDAQALQYLKDRYHQEFSIGESDNADSLGGPITYNKWVTPKSDPTTKFIVKRCLGNCKSGWLSRSTEFSDNYLQLRWKKQLTYQFKKEFALTNNQSIGVTLSDKSVLGGYDKSEFVDFDFYKQDITERQKYNLNVSYDETDGSYTLETREQHARKILKIINFVKNTGASVGSISYKVQANRLLNDGRYIKDEYNFKSEDPVNLKQVGDIFPLFMADIYVKSSASEGYEIRKDQDSIEKGYSTGRNGSPNFNTRAMARKELEIANRIKGEITSNYLVAPVVVTEITLNSDVDIKTLNISTMASSNYVITVGVYNYSNIILPISLDKHKANAAKLVDMLKNDFKNSNLVYKSDFPVCRVSEISSVISSVDAVTGCFK